MWRLVLHEPPIASLEEIERSWTICDVADANDALDALEEARADAQRIAEEKARRDTQRDR